MSETEMMLNDENETFLEESAAVNETAADAYGDITRRADGSYVIEKNGIPYHVPDTEEFAEEFAAIDAYAQEHTDEVKEEPAPPAPTFEELKERKKREIISYYDCVMATAKEGYSAGEIDTWDVQRKGAADILAGDTSTTEAQFVTTLAANRSATSGVAITTEYLARRIQGNVAAAQALSLAALGKQQGEYDLACAATSAEELAAIVPSFVFTAEAEV